MIMKCASFWGSRFVSVLDFHRVSSNSPTLVNSAEPIFTMNFTVFFPNYWLSPCSHWMSR